MISGGRHYKYRRGLGAGGLGQNPTWDVGTLVAGGGYIPSTAPSGDPNAPGGGTPGGTTPGAGGSTPGAPGLPGPGGTDLCTLIFGTGVSGFIGRTLCPVVLLVGGVEIGRAHV